LVGREEQRLLVAGLRRLPIELQIAIELYYWEQWPIEEIGEATKVPPGTVKSRLFRARALLGRAIEAADDRAELVRSTLTGLDDWVAKVREQLFEESSK
jgi:RNA polymerase sigma-70 factor (ECF subfamily)